MTSDGQAVERLRDYLRTLKPEARAMLITELDGQKESVRREIHVVEKIIRRQKPLFVETGLGDAECEDLWKIRREFSYSLRDTRLTKLNEDIVVPRGRLEDLFRFAAKLQKKHRLQVACFGHAGDGNIHVNFMIERGDSEARERARLAERRLFEGVVALEGSISGEHGIGFAKAPYLGIELSTDEIALMKRIKAAFDPNNILNPGKIFAE